MAITYTPQVSHPESYMQVYPVSLLFPFVEDRGKREIFVQQYKHKNYEMTSLSHLVVVMLELVQGYNSQDPDKRRKQLKIYTI